MSDSKSAPEGASYHSILEADRDRAVRSRHGGMGAAGYISESDSNQAARFLSRAGDVAVINSPQDGLTDLEIGMAWDNVAVQSQRGFLARFFKKRVLRAGVDLDLGCLYVLKDGTRGGLQAFGEDHGDYDRAPFIELSGDERRGDKTGLDEVICVNGRFWDRIEKMLIYVYIYDGVRSWAAVRPQIQVRVPNMEPMVVTLNDRKPKMSVCAVAGLANVRDGIKMTNYLEYFHGHQEMDRAFGYGLEWESGTKS